MFDDDKYIKIFDSLETLIKADTSLEDALRAVRRTYPKEGSVLARHLYVDSMTGKVGNKKAYSDFLSRHGNSGIHLSLDANGFGSINKEYGHSKGDEAIKQLFSTISDVSRKYSLKAFRTGGDEGRLHAPTPERANGFIKELKDRLEKAPALPGTKHKLSVSVGIGYTPDHAEKALIEAKNQLGPMIEGSRKKAQPPGAEPTVFHSLLHEAPPENWRPSSGKIPQMPHEEEQGVVPSKLKIANPLKVKE
jgi:diguanylate cyclase (GGDEF)-like protein